MKITKAKLKKILLEEIEEVIKSDQRLKAKIKDKDKYKKERDAISKKRSDNMMKHAGHEVGLEEDGPYPCGSPNANPYHDENGEWASSEDATSWAISGKGSNCLTGQFKDKYKGVNREPCGRKDRSKKCKDASESLITDADDDQDLLYKYEKLQLAYRELLNKAKQLAAKHNDDGVFNIDQCAKFIDGVVRASKGDLIKKK